MKAGWVLICLVGGLAAGRYIPSGKTYAETKRVALHPLSAFPDNFFWGNVSGTNFLTVSRNQHIPEYCGACWAFATTSALSDRIKILRNATWPDINLAPQVLLSCDTDSQGCSGGDSLSAYAYIQNKGITDETCSQYRARGYTNGLECSKEVVCMNCATNGTCFAQDTSLIYGVEQFGALEGEDEIMNELLNGPLACAIDATAAFDNYTAGIFNDTTGAKTHNHVISLVGWGVQSNVKYWIGRNSWGTYWGEKGFFRIVRGTNNLGIEDHCVWATPKPAPVTVQSHPSKTSISHVLSGAVKAVVEPIGSYQPEEYTAVADVTVPTAWDWRNVSGQNYLSWNRNQHIPQYCGACWAFAATSSIADRFNILKNNSFPQVSLSPQVMLNCAAGGSCSAGDPYGVYKFAYQTGIPDDTCQQYTATEPDYSNDCTPTENCMACVPPVSAANATGTCYPVSNYTHYYVSQFGNVKGVAAMQQQIYLYGPISCGMMVTPQFDAYTGGIFYQQETTPRINHQISLVGWGQEDGVDYWVGRNQWGTYWGENGFFRIRLGTNVLAIESQCSWGYPSFTKSS